MSDDKVVPLATRQKPVTYTVHFVQGFDGSLEFQFEGFEDTPANRERVAHAMERCAETLKQVDAPAPQVKLPEQSHWSKEQAVLLEQVVKRAQATSKFPFKATPTFGHNAGIDWTGALLTDPDGTPIGHIRVEVDLPYLLKIDNAILQPLDGALQAAWSELNPTTEE
jgi:hypothetical protein